MARPLKIAIGVHGRFHAFDVARTLAELGQEVTLFTNYPALAKRRFALEGVEVITFTSHGLLVRALARTARGQLVKRLEPALHRAFGRWLARQVQSRRYDTIDIFSSVGEETLNLKATGVISSKTIITRGSSHIRTQHEILETESRRTGITIAKPSQWVIEREEREYRLADCIRVLSSFASRSFVDRGIHPSKLALTPLGVNTSHFHPPSETIERRRNRILQGAPLRVLYVGLVGWRKGLWDMTKVANTLRGRQFNFTLVGSVTPEARNAQESLPSNVRIAGHQPQDALPNWYANADIFLFPTLEDGFAAVLAQAQAAGLPIIATTNCSAPDFVEEGKSGWIVPIRSPESIIERLLWCDANRPALADMVTYTYEHPYVRDWLNVGRNYLSLMQEMVAES